jgi:hypothetical protein
MSDTITANIRKLPYVHYFETLVGRVETSCRQLKNLEIPQSATPEMLIDAKQQAALALRQLFAFAIKIDGKLKEKHHA